MNPLTARQGVRLQIALIVVLFGTDAILKARHVGLGRRFIVATTLAGLIALGVTVVRVIRSRRQ